MIDMLLAAKRAWFVECHLRIQRLVAGLVGYDAYVVQNFEIRTFKHLVLSRADKNKFHILCCHHPKIKVIRVIRVICEICGLNPEFS
jgi:hypothetical protein